MVKKRATFSKLVRENNFVLENEIKIVIWRCYSDIIFNAYFQICSSRATTAATHVIWVVCDKFKSLNTTRLLPSWLVPPRLRVKVLTENNPIFPALPFLKLTFRPLKIGIPKRKRASSNHPFFRGFGLLVSAFSGGRKTTTNLRLPPSRIHKTSPTSPFRWGGVRFMAWRGFMFRLGGRNCWLQKIYGCWM